MVRERSQNWERFFTLRREKINEKQSIEFEVRQFGANVPSHIGPKPVRLYQQRSQANCGRGAGKDRQTTAEIKRNAKSVAEGVKEGWSRDKERVDLNSATREQLVGTGLTRTQSDRVIEHRPYATTRELLTKHVLSEDEYREIAAHVKAGDPSDSQK